MPKPPNPSKQAKGPAAEVRATAKKLQRLDARLKAAAEQSGGFYFTPSPAAIGSLPTGKGQSVELGAAAEGGVILKLASGEPEAKSGGPIQGFSIRAPEAFGREASTKKVRVEVLVRSAGAEPTRLGIAYPKNEVEGSRWRWREVGPGWALCKVTWNTPQMKEGRGAFIGLLADKPGTPGVEIHSVGATILA